MFLYVDCAAGASGDMLLAGLVDLGYPLSGLHRVLRQAGLPDVRVGVERVKRDGVSALRLRVIARGRSPRSNLILPPRASDLLQQLKRSALPLRLKRQVIRVFRLLASAEAWAHRTASGRVLFHQLARLDTLVCVAGFCRGLSHLGVRSVHVSPIPLGTLHRDPHGRRLRRPGPTARRLLRRFPVQLRPAAFEWTTPTGAALLAAFASPVPPPPLRIIAIGRSAGHATPPCGPCALQLLLGESS